nr:insulinase family protein [Spirochaeta sp.]
MKHNIAFLFTLLLATIAGLFPIAAETASSPRVATFTDDALLPFNPAIRSGRMENGMEFYLLEHPHPEDTVMLRLIVDAGSVLETDDQEGLAHFVEHMAFNGTERFDETELVAYLERLGMQFGPDVNAYTTFQETVYKLEVPASDPEALETGFRVMEQWASALSFEPEAIDRERGVIVEEWRRGQNAAQRILRSHIPVLLKESRYAERLPIGDMDVVRNAPRSEFVDFYDRWYRPDNMAFVAVGDIPMEELTALTQRFLGDISRPETPLNRPYHFVPFHEDTRISIATDTEAQRSTVAVYTLGEPAPFERVHDYRTLLVRSLFASIMNERLRDLARDADAPITGAGLGWNRFLRGTEIAAATAVVRDANVTEALELILREVERANRFGVSTGELERARDRLLESIDSARANFTSRSSAGLADELVRFWTEGEAVPGIEIEYDLYHEILPSISTGEVSDVATEFARDTQRVILAGLRVGADGLLPDGTPVPTEAELRNTIAGINDLELRLGEEELLPETLIDPERIPEGETISETDHAAVETTELVLSNGMRVFLKPTELSDDEILFSAYSPGGLANVETPLVPAARLAPTVTQESGIGLLDAATLEKVLSGRSVQLATGIGRVSETMSGSSRGEDLELLFQLINLGFTAPRFDEQQLENVRQRMIQAIEGRRASPQGQFGRRLQEMYANGDPRLRALTEDEVRAVTIDEIASVYRDRFADPADFALFFVGSLDPDRVRELAERYLAGIPSATNAADRQGSGFLETVAPAATSRPEGITADVVRAGEEPVGQVVALFHGP